jgi:hypothetical protein
MIWVLIAAALATGILASCGTLSPKDNCLCVTRHASGEKGAPLDTWVNFGENVAVAELTFLSIRGDQGIEVLVANQTRKLTAIQIDNLGPDLFGVPPGAAIQIRCAQRVGHELGCEVDYRFRWLH